MISGGNDYRSSWHNLWICWFLDKYKINFLVLVEIFGAPIYQVLLCFISGWYIQDHFRVSFSDTLKELGVTVLESILFFFGEWTLYQVIANFYKRIYSLYYMIVMAEQFINQFWGRSGVNSLTHRLLNSMELWSGYFYVLKFCSVLFLSDEEHFLNQLINLNYLGISGTVFFL